MHVQGKRRTGRVMRSYRATFEVAAQTKSTCATCGGPTRTSRYGILHEDCFACRYLKMIYGPSITVERTVY